MNRRRFLTITAAAAGLSLVPSALVRAAAGPALHRWQGTALGAHATILLHHADGDAAQHLVSTCVDEIARLEKVFSLHQADSAISRLNRSGALEAPPFDMVRLLSECRRFSRLTGGAFDATVQPLWRLYAEHFSHVGADLAGPGPDAVSRARDLVDHAAVSVDSARIAFARPGMAVTLNGIAQGYITDRVVDLLRARGIEQVLVDLGEVRALGSHPSGRPWRVGVRDPRAPGQISGEVELSNRAIATSAAGATRFDESGRHHHLFDPKTGRSSSHALGLSVLARDATTADALSTAFSVMPENEIQAAVGTVFDGAAALIVNNNGETVRYGA